MDLDDPDEEKELLEDELRRVQKIDSVATISKLRLKPDVYSRQRIPLCMLVPMLVVRPTLASDVKKLENEFTHGYLEGFPVFYLSTTDEAGEMRYFSDAEVHALDPFWQQAVQNFNSSMEANPETAFMKNMKFFVCDGNHRREAWMKHISRVHPHEWMWHISVDSIILETKGRIEVVMQVMHDINK